MVDFIPKKIRQVKHQGGRELQEGSDEAGDEGCAKGLEGESRGHVSQVQDGIVQVAIK
jgi:hypothetical protein